MFTVALFTTARAWKQPRRPLKEGWMKRRYTHTVGHQPWRRTRRWYTRTWKRTYMYEHTHMYIFSSSDSYIYMYTAAAAKSVQSCPTVRPHRPPTRLPSPWDSPGKNIGVGCHFILQYMHMYIFETESVCWTPETKTTLWVNCTSI